MSWKTCVINTFDKAAECYGQYNDVQQKVAQTLMRFMPATSPASILELGCGNGVLTRLLANQYPTSTLHATDISPAMLAQAQQALKSHTNIKLSVMDAENLTSSQRYDCIISSMTAQWFENLPATLKNWQAHLKPNGVIIIARPAETNFPEWSAALNVLNLPSGALPFQSIKAHKQETQIITRQYGSTLNFLKVMKKTGATTARPGYTKLSAKQLPPTPATFSSTDLSFHRIHIHNLPWH